MLVTSVVRPPYCVITSPGRIEVPLTAFSAIGSRPVTRTGQSTSGSAAITAATTPAPVMSRFMVTIDWPGLMERPPLSKVMPLPTSTTCLALREPFGGLVVDLHEPRRRGGALADADDAAEAALGELLLVEHGGLQAGGLGGGDGLLGQPLRAS